MKKRDPFQDPFDLGVLSSHYREEEPKDLTFRSTLVQVRRGDGKACGNLDIG
jgi:hypothetical protein